jgi:hypothetical protein
VLSNQTVERQGMVRPFTDNYRRRLWREISKRGRGILYTARDLDGQPVATLLVVHDDRTSCQIVSGVDMTVHNSPAGPLLMWRAIRDALNAGRIFDFEGSRIRGVEEYYRRWGGQAHPVWQLNKTGSLRASLARLVFNSFHDDKKTARRSRITSGSHGSVPNTSPERSLKPFQKAANPPKFIFLEFAAKPVWNLRLSLLKSHSFVGG